MQKPKLGKTCLNFSHLAIKQEFHLICTCLLNSTYIFVFSLSSFIRMYLPQRQDFPPLISAFFILFTAPRTLPGMRLALNAIQFVSEFPVHVPFLFVHLFMHSFSTHLWSNHTVLAAAVGSGKGPQTGTPSSESFHLGPLGYWNQLISALSSVQFSRSFVSDSLQPHESQHARPPCLLPTARVYPNPCPLSQWCHPTISSSVVPFSSCPQSFPASGSFQMSQLFASDGQSTGALASTSVLPMNTQDWSPLGWTGWISLPSKGL